MIFKKIGEFLKKKAGLVMAIFGGVGLSLMTGSFAHAEDFDASSTQTIVTNALSVPKSTLAWGIPLIIGIGLSIWAIFWLIHKLKTHVK